MLSLSFFNQKCKADKKNLSQQSFNSVKNASKMCYSINSINL